jgi:hypothetical protein
VQATGYRLQATGYRLQAHRMDIHEGRRPLSLSLIYLNLRLVGPIKHRATTDEIECTWIDLSLASLRLACPDLPWPTTLTL